MKYNDNGEYKDIYVKAFDTLPVGTEVDYDGSTVPSGWTQVADPNTYSTDEVKIGTWINGKPLYRKTIIIENVVKGTATTYNHGIQNVDTIFIDANSFYKFSGGTPLANMLNNYQNIDKQMTRTVATSTIIEYYVGDYVVSGITDGYITVYYTKTTD